MPSLFDRDGPLPRSVVRAHPTERQGPPTEGGVESFGFPAVAPRLAPAMLLMLQRNAGNAAVARLLRAATGAERGGAATIQRVTKRKAAFNPARFLQDPAWGNYSSNLAGGRFMKVRLGPLAYDSTARGSVPGTQACTAVNALNRQQRGGFRWIKGHLLNENLGGPGSSYNLTPLTHDANGDHHDRVEALVKNAIVWCKQRADYHRRDDWWYGVYYEVKVVGSTYNYGPAHARAVGHHLECRAVWIKQEKVNPGNVTPFDGSERQTYPALPAGVVQVACVQ